jgi:hypothetical protein
VGGKTVNAMPRLVHDFEIETLSFRDEAKHKYACYASITFL